MRICKASVVMDEAQYGNGKYIIFLYYHLILGEFESSMAEYQQYFVLKYLRKKRNLTQYNDPVIYRAVCHQHTSDL